MSALGEIFTSQYPSARRGRGYQPAMKTCELYLARIQETPTLLKEEKTA